MARRIGPQQVAFFRYELERGDAKRKKTALQDICALYRSGYVLPADQATQFETVVNGIVLQENQDPKVVRWCLNALAQFGRKASSRTYVETALHKYTGDPEIEAAGVAALCRMYRGSVQDIHALEGIDPIVWKLAALQNTDPKKLELGGLTIDIYRVAPPVLRLALITVGLNKDIENLFHPKHSNSEFVRNLGQHDDDVVQQYTVWSVIENRRLTFGDLGIPLDKIEDVKPNVQSKMYQLVAERDPDIRRRLEITERGSSVAPDLAREGLAKGVRAHYYDGLEEVTIPWFRQEQHKPVREFLAEHFARFSGDCGPYEELATEIYDTDLELRNRVLLGAEGKPLYARLKGAAADDLLASLQPSYDVVRALREQAIGTNLRPSLRVLMLTASPLDADRVRIDAEYRDIKEQLDKIRRPKRDVRIILETAVRLRDILPKILNSDAVDLFHFSGHGSALGLIFEDESGNAKLINATAVAGYFQTMGRSLECAILNACFTDALAKSLTPHVEVIIGCDSTVDDDAAVVFSSSFYQAVATGRPYEEAFRVAVNELRATGFASDAKKYVLRQR